MTTRLSRDTLLLLVSNIGSAALLFVLSALIGRALGSSGLGAYAVALAWVYPLSLLVEFGLATLLTRDLAQRPQDTSAILAPMMLARLMIGISAALALFLTAPLLSADPVIVAGIHVSAPLVFVLPLFSTFTAVFRARGVMLPIPALNIGMLVAQVALTAWALQRGGGVVAVLVVNTITSAGQAAAAWWVYRRYFATPANREALQPALSTVLPLLRRALPFALAAVFAALQMRLSLVLLEQLANRAEAGYFTAASRFVEAARLFPNAFFGALFPALSMLAADPLRLRQTFRRASRALALFGVLAGGGLTLAALPLLNLVYGTDFDLAAPTLVVLSWSLVFGVLRGVRTLYWYAVGREQYVNFVNGAVIVLQVALGVWLVPVYGAMGAALGFLVVEAAALALLWREIRIPRINRSQTNHRA